MCASCGRCLHETWSHSLHCVRWKDSKDGRLEGWKDGRKDGSMEGWMDGRMEGWKDGRMGGWEVRAEGQAWMDACACGGVHTRAPAHVGASVRMSLFFGNTNAAVPIVRQGNTKAGNIGSDSNGSSGDPIK
jgi:hypothetical protein